ncbi:MAG: Hsp70 family protein [Armatimonadota bacterium]
MAILGIDLGTSNSAAAVAVGGVTHMIQPVEGPTEEGLIFPSYIAFDVYGNAACSGLLAKRQFHGAADLIVRHVKRLMGHSYDYVVKSMETHNGISRRRTLDEFKGRITRGDTGEVLIRVGKRQVKQYTPQEIATFLLGKIREDAELQMRRMHGTRIDQVVITVPAGFDDAPLRATMWAGEQVFGAGNVHLIPEPLAAAIASGTQKSEEMIMVVDMGAGTTDIVVGNVVRVGSGYEWIPVTQSCDDELGGWDMDYQILEQLLLDDRKAPYLRDLYPHLDIVNQGKLMEAIERAKIAVSTSGTGYVSTVLEATIDTDLVRKPVMHTLDDATLRKVVAYKEPRTYEDPGSVVSRCRTLVERTLLEIADNNADRIAEARASLDRVILVGGPMRMRCLYDMMAEVFSDRPQVLEAFDPLNTFPMECVARGAAMYQGERVMLQVPHTISVFTWSKGGSYAPVILRNTPFEGEAESTVEVEVEEGSSWMDIVTEKENLQLPDYPVREHLVRTPRSGKLEVTLRWDASGCRISLNGAGITQFEIPSISEQTTLRENLGRQFANLLYTARNLRPQLEDPHVKAKVEEMLWENVRTHAPEDIAIFAGMEPDMAQDSWVINGKPVREIIREEADKTLAVPPLDLEKCDALDLQYASNLLDSELKMMLDKGFVEGAREAMKVRGLSEKVFNAVRVIRGLNQEKTTVVDLQNMVKTLLRIAENAEITNPLIAELKHLSEELSRHPSNRVMVANVAVRAAALADVLQDLGYISRDAMQRAKFVVAKVQVDQ